MNELADLIERTGIAKKKIAEIAGVTPVTITRWVNGDTPAPPLVLEKLRQIDKVING
jgi:transcriptional regulator with XRE-family HTH domain